MIGQEAQVFGTACVDCIAVRAADNAAVGVEEFTGASGATDGPASDNQVL